MFRFGNIYYYYIVMDNFCVTERHTFISTNYQVETHYCSTLSCTSRWYATISLLAIYINQKHSIYLDLVLGKIYIYKKK
jgi:hypothetical protein